MKIVAPLSKSDSYEILAQAGADEFYCGYVPPFWLKKFGMAISLNRREYFSSANIYSFSTMEILSNKMKYYKIPIKITFNEISYPYFSYPEILNVICKLMRIGYSSFIISDIGLLLYLRENKINCDIHLSGETLVINSHAMAFFDELNISRYIFPRRTSLSAIKHCIAKRKNVDCTYEAFVLNANCRYVGGFCNSLHCDELVSFCCVPSEFKLIDRGKKTSCDIRYLKIHQGMQNHIFNSINTGNTGDEKYKLGVRGCGLCQVKTLMDAGVSHLKIVGRGNSDETVCQDITNLRKAISMTNQILNSQDFENEIKRVFFSEQCPKNFCYYP